jgi:hypothetical protein
LRYTHVRHLLESFTSTSTTGITSTTSTDSITGTTSATSITCSTSTTSSSNLLLCNISQIATGLPYSEYPRQTVRCGPSLIKLRCNLTCFRPVQSFDGLGSSPHSAVKHYTLGGGPVLTVLFLARAHQRLKASINPLLIHSL